MICTHKDVCGGCTYQGIPYEKQLEIKENLVRKLIDDKGLEVKNINNIVASNDIYYYRNKMEYTFGKNIDTGQVSLGMHKKNDFAKIVDIPDCNIAPKDFSKIVEEVKKFSDLFGYEPYNKKSHKGILRNLVVRKGFRTNELLVNLVLSRQGDIDKKSFISSLLRLDLEAEIIGILITYNDSKADMVKEEDSELIYGRDHYIENINNLSFNVGAFSFFQTNIGGAEKMYSYAIDNFTDLEDKVVFDLYCGTGTITQILSKKAKEVVGIDIVDQSIEMAKSNSKVNNLKNCSFYTGDVFKVLNTIDQKPDVLSLDPPRAGIEPKAIDKILSYEVDNILYISCNPKSLVKNLYYMNYYGYEIKSITPFDNFPMTDHVECVVLMSKVK